MHTFTKYCSIRLMYLRVCFQLTLNCPSHTHTQILVPNQSLLGKQTMDALMYVKPVDWDQYSITLLSDYQLNLNQRCVAGAVRATALDVCLSEQFRMSELMESDQLRLAVHALPFTSPLFCGKLVYACSHAPVSA